MNRSQRRRMPRADTHPVSGLRIKDATSTELHQQLVKDALTGVATPLPYFVAACSRIARLDRTSSEAAYQRVRQEVRSLGGVLPGAPGQ